MTSGEVGMQRFRWMVVGAALAVAGSGTALAGGAGPSMGAGTCGLSAVRGTYGIHGTGFVAGSPFSMIGTAFFDGAGGHTGATTESVGGSIDDSHYHGTYDIGPDCTGTTTIDMQHEARFDGHVIDLVVTAGGQRILWFLRDTESRQGPDLPDADDATFTISGFLERM